MEIAAWVLDILMECHEKSVLKVSLMEYHEELVNVGVDTLMEYHMKSELWRFVTPAEFCWAYPWICGTSVFSE